MYFCETFSTESSISIQFDQLITSFVVGDLNSRLLKKTGQFSAILTLAAAVQLLGFVFMLQEVNRNGNFSGLSVRMLMCYVPVYCFRLTSTLIEEGYLPVDRSGDWCYQLADVAALSLVFVLLWKSWKNPTVRSRKFNLLTFFCLFVFRLQDLKLAVARVHCILGSRMPSEVWPQMVQLD